MIGAALPLSRIKRFANPDATHLVLILFVFSMVTNALVNFWEFKIVSGDPAIFTQMFFNTLHGDFMYSTFEGGNHLGVHFSPVLMLLIPVMAIFKSVSALMITHTLLLAFALFRLYEHVKPENPHAGLIMVILLICHPTLIHDSYDSFHALSLMTLPFISMFIAYENRRFRTFIIWALVLATIRENMFLALLGWSGICFVTKYERKWFVATLVLALIQFAVANVIAPAWIDGGIRPSVWNYFQAYGSNPTEVFQTLWGDPLLPLRMLFSPEKGAYVVAILLPFLLVLPILRWRWLLPAIPTLGVILFSSEGRLAHPRLHFSVEIVLWSALAALVFLREKELFLERKCLSRCLKGFQWVFICFLGYQISANLERIQQRTDVTRHGFLNKMIHEIDPEARLVARRYLANPLAWRKQLYFLYEVESSDSWSEKDLLILEEKDLHRIPEGWEAIHRVGGFFLFAPKEKPPEREDRPAHL